MIPDITGIEFRKRFSVKIQKRLWGEKKTGSGTWHPVKGRPGPGIPAIEEIHPDEDQKPQTREENYTKWSRN